MSLNNDEKKILKEKIRDQRREMWDGERPVRRPRSNQSSSRTTQEPLTEKQTNSDSASSSVQGTDWNHDISSPSQPWKFYVAIALSAATIIGLGFCLGYIFAS